VERCGIVARADNGRRSLPPRRPTHLVHLQHLSGDLIIRYSPGRIMRLSFEVVEGIETQSTMARRKEGKFTGDLIGH